MKLRTLGRNKFDDIIKRKKPNKAFDNKQNNKVVKKVEIKPKTKKLTSSNKNQKVTSSTQKISFSPPTTITNIQPVSEGPIDILMLTENDWANTGYRFHKCLKLLGLRVEVYKGNKHRYDYPEQAPTLECLVRNLSPGAPRIPIIHHTTDPILADLIGRAKVVNFHASSFYTIPNYELIYKTKKMVATHGGQSYRKLPDSNNAIKFITPLHQSFKSLFTIYADS
jgi:hypothetical protein